MTLILIIYSITMLFALGVFMSTISVNGEEVGLIMIFAAIWPIILIIFLGMKFGKCIDKFI